MYYLSKLSKATFKKSIVTISILTTFACVGPANQEEIASKEAQKIEERNRLETDNKSEKTLILQQAQKAYTQAEYFEAETAQVAEARQTSALEARRAKLKNYIAAHPIHPIQLDSLGPSINNENYQSIDENKVKLVSKEPVSTFSIDVDTGSYSNARRMLMQGNIPPSNAVRVEEFINYFDYQYPLPQNTQQPFSVNSAVSISPWDEHRHVLRIGLKGYEPKINTELGRNLVFLLDVSGSMNQANKLPLLKRSLTMLTNQLNENDSVAIVVYAGASGVVLKPTSGNEKSQIINALEKLQAGGSTNGSAGIQLAYQLAQDAFIENGVNRVILATDGDFNVGMVNQSALIDLIEKKREKGIALTTLGFGQGNYNDYLMEQLADTGNGNYAYIDTINEARKVLVDELTSNMQIIAKDVKIQVEFNPNLVAEYRLIGYENRKLANEDFNNDKVDAGDIGAGHSVTALYELTLVDSASKFNDTLRYQNKERATHELSDELALIKLRYKLPSSDTSSLIEQVISKSQISPFDSQADDFKFATAVASFAQLIKDSKYIQSTNYKWIAETAFEAKGIDRFGYRGEFIQLVKNADALSNQLSSN